MEETFTAGIRPGGLTEGREIRILVCHILSELSEPMSFDEMTEAILSDGTANYFEFADALAELRETGCIVSFKTEAGINEYTVTEKGKELKNPVTQIVEDVNKRVLGMFNIDDAEKFKQTLKAVAQEKY